MKLFERVSTNLSSINIKRFFQNDENSLFRIYILFLFLIIVVFFICGNFTKNVLDKYYFLGFFESLSASFIEDFIFFVAIGYLTFIISLKKPEDNILEIRIKTLANSNKVSVSAKNFLLTKIPKLLIYNADTKIKLTILEYNPNYKAVRVYIEWTSTICNMCKDVDYPDRIGAVISPGAIVDNDAGSIYHLSIVSDKASNVIIDEKEEDNKINIKNNIFKADFDFNIPQDGQAYYKLCYTIWNPVWDRKEETEFDDNLWIYHQVLRYTEKFDFIIENKLLTYPKIEIQCKLEKKLIEKDDIVDIELKSNKMRTLKSDITLLEKESFNIRILEPLK